MKLRKGFVSNSSSASFIITAEISPDMFINTIYKNIGNSCRSDNFINEIELQISMDIYDEEEAIKASQEEFDKSIVKNDLYRLFVESMKTHHTKRIDYLKEILEEVKDKKDIKESVKKYYQAHGVKIDMSFDTIVTLEGRTSMFNDYNDVPEKMKNIIMELIFAGSAIKINGRVEDD